MKSKTLFVAVAIGLGIASGSIYQNNRFAIASENEERNGGAGSLDRQNEKTDLVEYLKSL